MIKIFEHFWIKIIALVLGLLLWFHVATEKEYNYQVLLPVSEIALDEGLTLSQKPPDSLMIVVSATGKQLLRKKWRERGLKMMANQMKPGRHKLRLTTSNTFLSLPTSEISLDDIIFPTSIILVVDRLKEVKAKVTPDIITNSDEGYAVSIISNPDPPEVTLIGPQSIIKKYPIVFTQQKEITGLRNNITLTLPLVKPSGYGISLKPDSVSLTIEVVPVKTRIFEYLPIVIYNTPTNQKVISKPSGIRIELTGSPTEIDLLSKNALIASVDYRHIDSIGRTAIKIDCPSKFKVKNSSADSVTLSIQ